jgi:transcriptional regulator with XRE-family HTH domain
VQALKGLIRIRALRMELARRNMRQQALAHLLGVAPSTLSGWLHGAYPPPKNLAARIEAALKVKRGRIDPTYEKPRATDSEKSS